MSDALPQKTRGDYVHLAARVGLSAIPLLGGPAVELLNAVITPSVERRRNDWLNDVARRLKALEEEKRLKIEDLAENDEFISALMQATTVAVRNHQQEKINALRNAVLNSALGKCPSHIKGAMFLALVDQFTVWHLRVLKELSDLDSEQRQNKQPQTSIKAITDVVMKRMADLRGQQVLAEIVVEDLCRKGLLFWNQGASVTYIQRDTSQVTQLGEEFLAYVSTPEELSEPEGGG